MPRDRARTPVRTALRNRRLMRMLLAYAGSAIAEWALWLAVLVYSFERGGSTVAGFAAIGLLVPAAAIAPVAGRAADGSHPSRVLLLVYVAEAASLTAAALFAWAEAPVALVIVAASVAISGITFIRPAISVIVPGLVVEPADLVAANLLTGNADSISVFVGPVLAGSVLALGGPALVFASCAVLDFICAALTLSLVREVPRLDVLGPTVDRDGRLRELVGVMRSLGRQRGSTQVLLVLGGQYALVGALDLLVINLAFRVLHLGSAGPGLLSGAFGLGAVIGGLSTAAIIGRPRLAIVMIAGLAVIGAAMFAVAASTTLLVAFIALPVAGASRSLLDVSGRSLLQRSAPQDALASVFAVLEALAGLGILTGSLLVQILVATSGLRAAFVGVGAFFVLLCAATASGLRHADEHADAPVVQIRLMRSVSLLAPLPGPVLEGLARSSELQRFAAMETIMHEGDVGEHYYVVADGEVEVTIAGEYIRTIRRGQGFGEIALLADVPRTATIVAMTPTSVLSVDRAGFLSAVTGHDASARLAWAAARSMMPELDLGARSTDDT